MQARLKELKDKALSRLALVRSPEELEQVRIQFLGRKGELTRILLTMVALWK